MGTNMISERWDLRLKKDLLHRNANSGADFLVELVIRVIEDLAESTEIRVLSSLSNIELFLERYFPDRRRLATASYRVRQSSRSHRWALKHFQLKPEKIRQTGDRNWEVEGRTA